LPGPRRPGADGTVQEARRTNYWEVCSPGFPATGQVRLRSPLHSSAIEGLSPANDAVSLMEYGNPARLLPKQLRGSFPPKSPGQAKRVVPDSSISERMGLPKPKGFAL